MRKLSQLISYEYRLIFKDSGAFLILIGALIIYSLLYGFIYEPEVVRNIPVAVVDMDNSEASRDLIQKIDATPQANVDYQVTTLAEAKQMFLDSEISGVLYIPENYESDIIKSKQTFVSIYADGSYFLLYNNFVSAMANVVMNKSVEVKTFNLVNTGLDTHTAQNIAVPLQYNVTMLYNPYVGYASALLPAVLILILQQVILIGIGLISGTQSEFRKWHVYSKFSNIEVVSVKFLCYFLLYIPFAFYLLWVNYRFFGYPFNGSGLEQVMLLVPYVASSIFAGIAFGGLMRRRESSILYLAAFSILFLMISGISWPKEGMPMWFYYVGKILPSSSAIEAWTAMRTMGTTIYNVMPQWILLWVLTAVYGVLALFSVRYARKREQRNIKF